MSAVARQLPIRRNTALLAAALASSSAMLQLSAAVASLTLVLVLDVDGLLGLGPAIVLSCGALAAVPAGRAMDRFGRVPVLVTGFGVGAGGCGLAALGSALGAAPLVLLGLACVGTGQATSLLARTAAGDMYPPARRARGIALVLFGSVFGAILGPAVFSPLLHGRELDGDALAPLWLAAGVFMLLGMALVATIRPDPKRIAELLAAGAGGADLAGSDDADSVPRSDVRGRGPADREGPAGAPPGSPSATSSPAPTAAATARPVRDPAAGVSAPRPSAATLRAILKRPGVIPALVAAQASFAVMVGVMTLTGAIVVDHHHHGAHHVFPIIAAHVVGMYGLVIVVGDVVDRIGRPRALAGGLVVMAASVISLLWVEAVPLVAVALFGLGIGWNVSFVAATAQLADATAPSERGRVLGLNDLLSGATGAGLSLLGGLALTALGVAALAIGAFVLVLAPAAWIAAAARRQPPRPRPAESAIH